MLHVGRPTVCNIKVFMTLLYRIYRDFLISELTMVLLSTRVSTRWCCLTFVLKFVFHLITFCVTLLNIPVQALKERWNTFSRFIVLSSMYSIWKLTKTQKGPCARALWGVRIFIIIVYSCGKGVLHPMNPEKRRILTWHCHCHGFTARDMNNSSLGQATSPFLPFLVTTGRSWVHSKPPTPSTMSWHCSNRQMP